MKAKIGDGLDPNLDRLPQSLLPGPQELQVPEDSEWPEDSEIAKDLWSIEWSIAVYGAIELINLN